MPGISDVLGILLSVPDVWRNTGTTWPELIFDYCGGIVAGLRSISLLLILSGAIIDQVSFEPVLLTAAGLLLIGRLVILGLKSGR